METLDPWYVTGFVDGEGCFTFSRSGRQLALYFAVKLTAADRKLLAELQRFFRGAGRIYRVVARAAPTPRSGFTRLAAYYRICRQAELERVVGHFDAYPLRGVKAASYRIWREMVALKRQPSSQRRGRIEELALQLSAASPRNALWRGEGDLQLSKESDHPPA